MQLIDGKAIANIILDELKESISTLSGRPPGLAFVLVGEHAPSQAYVRMKEKNCKKIGIVSTVLRLPETISMDSLMDKVKMLNDDPNIDGIIIQQPLPSHLNTSVLTEYTSCEKDVDGFHPINIGKALLGEGGGFLPCTPSGVVELLKRSSIDPKGKHVVILGRSNIVGKPLAAMLMQKHPFCNATVTIAHSQTENLDEICRSADILVAAIGQPLFVKENFVKEGAVVIDVGINRITVDNSNKLVGDVDFDAVAPKTSAITPVPGGVGPMTIAMLLYNTYQSRLKCDS